MYDGIYTKQMLDDELNNCMPAHNLMLGLDKNEKFSWDVWDKKCRENIENWLDFDVKQLQALIEEKKKQIAILSQKINNKNNLDVENSIKSEYCKKWCSDFMKTPRAALFHDLYKKIAIEHYLDCDETSLNADKKAESDFCILLEDIYNRVAPKIGSVKDVYSLSYNGKTLEGVFVGESKTLELRMIIAGGWNIQKMHNRILSIDIKNNDTSTSMNFPLR